ncbi:MAG: hypothetical protein ACI8UO_000379 [Verrucomicrobiales bacterium]|jgi:hypothetical protein
MPMQFNLFQRIAEADAEEALVYSNELECFAIHRQFSLRTLKSGHRQQIRDVCREAMDSPPTGVAKLLDYSYDANRASGYFEVLPGQRLDSLVGLEGPLSISNWLDLAERMVETSINLQKHPDLVISWLPGNVNAWKDDDGNLQLAIAAFDVAEPEAPAVRESLVVGNLATLWFFMLTGDADISYYSLVGWDFDVVSEFRGIELLAGCFEALFHPQPSQRVSTLAETQQLLARIRDVVGKSEFRLRSSGLSVADLGASRGLVHIAPRQTPEPSGF